MGCVKAICQYIAALAADFLLFKFSHTKRIYSSYICNVYTGLSRGICNNIPPKPRPRESTVYTIYIPFRGLKFFMKILSDISPI